MSEIIRQILEGLLIAVNVMAWMLADYNRPPKPVHKIGEFVPYHYHL